MPNTELDLSAVTDDALLNELRYRLHARTQPSLLAAHSTSDPAADAMPRANAARQQMIRTLQLGRKRGQPVEILRFLVKHAPAPQIMSQIAAHMNGRGYRATRYYDASNALVAVGLAKRTFIGSEKAWAATEQGRAFLDT